ncbi:MAG: hypothetical protein J6K43_00990 [Lachnospiraceae bacterium]|nr:hypothetical protein [Lachnospiraceae bacterium]
MQSPTNELIAEIKRVIDRPPSRPIRLMFLENEVLYEMAQNQVKELFQQKEIYNMSDFMKCPAWSDRAEELLEVEQKYGQMHRKYRQILCEILEKAVIDFIETNDVNKVLIIQDEVLFSLGLDPVHFMLTYMTENNKIVNDSIPIIWLTIGIKEEYSVNEYCYYKTEATQGRTVKVEQSTFSSCVKDYKLPD